MTDALPHVSNWINGAHAAATPEHITVLNPATATPLATIDATPEPTIHRIIEDTLTTFQQGTWSRADASKRFTVLTSAARLLRAQLPDLIALETAQTGRPIREMRTQLARVPEWLEYFGALARVHEGRVPPFKGPGVVNTVTRQPVGVVGLITPYNHPLLIATKKLGAALAAGNGVILKASELAPLSVLRLGPLFQAAGLPDGVLQIVSGRGAETGKFLTQNPRLARIDLTGSLATYRAVAPLAARNLIPLTAELGGKAPVCLFPSLAVDTAVQAALFAGYIASGQTCVTGSRLLVHREMYEEFRDGLARRVRALRVGDPTHEATQIGPVISRAAVERCAAFVERAVQEGGRVLCGGGRGGSNRQGFYFEPTVIETQAGSDLACNEVFGPVIALLKCESEEEIVRVANGTSFALGASVWTNDFAQAHRVADQIDAGIVWINGHHLNDPSSPWGGFKESGIGKENGLAAYESYTKLKSTVVNYGVPPVWFDDEPKDARYG